MALHVRCTRCGHSFPVSNSLRGHSSLCPNCGLRQTAHSESRVTPAKRRTIRGILLTVMVVASLALLVGYFVNVLTLSNNRRASPSPTLRLHTPTDRWQQPAAVFQGTCIRAIDGDTIELNDGTIVRLMGVDTPESVHPTKPVEYYGKEAAAFTQTQVSGKRVTIVLDGNNAQRGHRDDYGRLLAYVKLPNGTDLSALLVLQGYARADTRFPCERIEQYLVLERAAQIARRGIWASGAEPTRELSQAVKGRTAVREWQCAKGQTAPFAVSSKEWRLSWRKTNPLDMGFSTIWVYKSTNFGSYLPVAIIPAVANGSRRLSGPGIFYLDISNNAPFVICAEELR